MTSKVLRAARALLKNPTAHDVLRALYDASPDQYDETSEVIREQCGRSVHAWFESTNRTLTEVLGLFDRAIAAAEESESK